MLLRLPLLLCLALAAACARTEQTAPKTAAAAPVDPATAAAITGMVLLDGPPPAPEMQRLDGDRNCVALSGAPDRPSEYIVGGDNGSLQHVFVYVKTGLEQRSFPQPTGPVILDQQKCRYVPRVVGVRVGQALQIRNSDPLLHNVRSEGAINQPFNMGQPVQGVKYTHTFTTAEVMVPFTCDVHAWMNAWAGVVNHPYFAVTAQPGTFSLDGLPPGTYTLEAWHETLGTQTQQVTVGPREKKDVRFTFTH